MGADGTAVTTGIVAAAAGLALGAETVGGTGAAFVLPGAALPVDAELEDGTAFFSGDFGVVTVDTLLDPAPGLLAGVETGVVPSSAGTADFGTVDFGTAAGEGGFTLAVVCGVLATGPSFLSVVEVGFGGCSSGFETVGLSAGPVGVLSGFGAGFAAGDAGMIAAILSFSTSTKP